MSHTSLIRRSENRKAFFQHILLHAVSAVAMTTLFGVVWILTRH